MTPDECLEALRIFQQKMVRNDRFPEIFLNSLCALFDYGGRKLKSAKLCHACSGYGLTRFGGCAFCSCTGYVLKYHR